MPPESLFLDTPTLLICSVPTYLSHHLYLLSYFSLPWPAIQISMHLRLGRITSPARTTPIVRHSPQQHLRPPHRSSLWMPLPLKALYHPRLAGRARHGTARTKMKTSTSRAVTSHNKVTQARRTKKLSSRHIYLALKYERSYLLKPLPSNLDSTQGEHNVSTHMNLKMGKLYHHALGHHHLWCDKVNERRTLSIVLSVS